MSDKNWALIAAAVVAVFVLSKKSTGGTTTGAATPGGSFGAVTQSQGTVTKKPGDLLNVTATWTPNTKNAAGQTIGWNYQVLCTYFVGGVGGVIIANGVQPAPASPATGQQTATFSTPAPDPSALGIGVGSTYDVVAHVKLQAAVSNADGTPGSAWVTVAEGDSNAITVTKTVTGGSAIPGATIGGVTLSQPGSVPLAGPSQEFIPAFSTRFNPGFGQERPAGIPQHGRLPYNPLIRTRPGYFQGSAY